ncbi:uncharacterized protein LOC119069403 isoform X2 [Bradysia coprophila]|uniref:uncharacterized protein LOC119069403 isoform X2 n=1 Tax=Bradysia coprophila TaxID=38358 RepID=UPI00187DC041|nr:uncharacterized protein LOC119069403 isoform X2 [Bradysia coprophila]
MYLVQTVQSTWRPQLPLPEEINVNNMDNMDNKSSSKFSNVNNKKWSLGSLFRRKKKDETSESSSEEDRKAGFTPQKRKPKPKPKAKRPNKLISAFDHIIIAPADKSKDTDSLKSFDRITTPTDSNRSTGSLDRRLRRERLRAARIYAKEVSSDEEIESINSSSMSRFRSDESIGNHSGSSYKKSRAARTERYMKRMSKGDELGQIVQQVSRWHTQPITPGFRYNEHSNNEHSYNRQPSEGLRTSASLTNVPSQKLNQIWSVPLRSKPQELIKDQENRSISYENHLYRPSSQRIINKAGPPAPPPRDPQRRLTIYNPSESRPLSYAFDKHTSNPQLLGISSNNRCVSDDRLWGGQIQQQQQPHRPASVQPVQEPRRFITRNETEFAKNMRNLSSQQGYEYLADAAPRSRRPIHVMPKDVKRDTSVDITEHSPPQVRLRTTKSGIQAPMKSAADFWKQIDQAESNNRSGRNTERMYTVKPRSVSHSRAHDLSMNSWSNHHPIDNGNVHRREFNVTSVILKPSKSCGFQPKTTVTNTAKAFEKKHEKTNSMPSYYTVKAILNSPANKYEEHVAKTVVQPMQPIRYKPKVPLPTPPSNRLQSQKYSTSEDDLLDGHRRQRKKSTNLEDAINELEAIYKSLGLGDENLMDRAERRDIPKFNQFNPVSNFNPDSDDNDNEIGENAEPDIVLDDVAYRNFKRANSIPKTIEPQPPFGIPIGPIPSTPPGSNYLHASPDNTIAKPMFIARKTPDLVSDDLAVRNLRKDSPVRQVGFDKVEHCIQPSILRKKQRAVRSMSENIYNLIQRDAAKPSGGCLDDYDVMAGSLNNAASLKDITSGDDNDHPTTLRLLQQEHQHSDVDHRSKGRSVVGAVFSLPSTLKTSTPAKVPFITKQHRPTMVLNQKPPIPLPRNNLSPDLNCDKSGMEDILNAIAKEAKESSEKLSRDLFELRKEMVSEKKDKEFRPGSPKAKLISNVKMEKDIDNVSRAAKRFEELLEDVVDAGVASKIGNPSESSAANRRSFSKEKQFLQNINDVADAAKACEQVIGMVVDGNGKKSPETRSPKSPRRETKKEKAEDSHSVAQLLEKLEPNVQHIGVIAERCMRQLSELGDMNVEVVEKKALPLTNADTVDAADYDNLNSHLITTFNQSRNDELSTETRSAEQSEPDFRRKVQEEIDKIMQECAEEAQKKCTLQPESKFVSSDEEMNILLLPPTETKTEKTTADDKPSTTPYSSPLDEQNKSSSDYLKSSSATPNRINSSSITSFNEQSSSDFAKSISSDNRLASEGIKTSSTTSCEPAQSPSAIKSSTVSPFTISPSPPLVLTPADDDERSLYNSSEELAMIFGIKTPSPSDLAPNQLLVDLEKTLIQSTATSDCQPSNTRSATADFIHPIESKSLPINRKRTITTVHTTYSPSCEILKSSFISPSNKAVSENSNEQAAVVPNDARPFSALYDIICKEKEIEYIMSNAPQTEQLAEKLLSLSMGLTEQNGSVDRRSAGPNEDQVSTSTTETEPPLDRTIHSPSTSQNNSKFTVAFKDHQVSDYDVRMERPDLSYGTVGMDASCKPSDSTLIESFCLHPNETSSGSLSLITASTTKPHIKSPTEGGRKALNQIGSDSEKSSSGGVGSSNVSISPTQNVRTTKASRLRAAALDKKLKLNGNSDQRQSPPIASNKPTSIKSLPLRPPTLQRSKRLVPSIDVSVQQTLNEHPMVPLVIEQKSDQISAVKLYASEPYASYNILSPRARNTLKADFYSPRTGSDESSGSRNSPHLSPMERDKSSKRKSNLNRSLTEEYTDENHLSRRRNRREPEGTKSLIPRIESLNLNRARDMHATSHTTLTQPTLLLSENASMKNTSSNGMYSPVERYRSSTVSPKGLAQKSHQNRATDHNTSDGTSSSVRSQRSINLNGSTQSSLSDTKYLQKNKRLLELSHKMERTKERTKAELAKIELITARCNNSSAELAPENICDLNASLRVDLANQLLDSAAVGGYTDSIEANRSDILVIQKPFQKKDRISFFDDNFLSSKADASSNSSFFRDRKRSHSTEEKYTFCDAVLLDDDYATTKQNRPSSTPSSELHLAPKKSPNLRRKSSEDGITATNHIVSILKKKDHNESSSASSNASPVTFSSSVVDTPTRSASRQGILKKRSSLDESRYSRSHSPDERSVLIRTPRRNSLEELQHGILKQRSYDSKTDLSVHNEPHGILKKKENCTPSETSYPKHVSISEAVILAAAELCKDAVGSDDEEYEIRPILKQDTPTISTPRPILKKKYSSESEEIRPILKTSRKSSREESDNDDYTRPSRKSDSPAKRRSFCDPFETNVVLERSRSMESHDNDRAVFVQPTSLAISEKPLVSVAERIKNMEKVLTVDKSAMNRRESNRQRFKTQPVTVNEISCALNKFHSPLNHRNHSFVTDFRSSTLFPEIENPLSLSAELCLTSLSSDSGILTAKLSDISNSGEFDKSPIRQQMENSGATEKHFSDVDHGNKTENGEDRKPLSRSDSVRARASMFQAMEEQRSKQHLDDGQRLSKSKSYVASQPEKVLDFDTKNDHRDAESHKSAQPETQPPPKYFMKGLQLPSDFSAELKSRLRKSTNASVSNLKKSASSIDAIRHEEPLLPSSMLKQKLDNQTSSASSSDTEEGKDLGKLLRSVSKENMNSVKRGLMNLNKMLEHSALVGAMSGATSTSDGESSGGREVATIIKNSAVARRKKFNEG